MQAGVAIRYARALLEIAIEEGKVTRIQDELIRFAEAYEGCADLRNVVLNPSISLEERKGLISRLGIKLRLSTTVTKFISLLLDKNRIDQIPTIGLTFQQLADARQGTIRADVASAVQLDAMQVAKIKATLGKLTGKKVILQTKMDASLLGGVVARVGGKVYDGSLRTQLETIKQAASAS